MNVNNQNACKELREKEYTLIYIRKNIREMEKSRSLLDMLRLFLLRNKREKLEKEIKKLKMNY